MRRFYPLTVNDIRRETAECVSVAFDVPASAKEAFQYTQGQYITLRTTINEEEVRRSYSICSSPLDNELRVAIKQVPEGRFSTFANQQLEVGTTLEAMPPDGRFYTKVNANNQKHYLAFAAGSGITPVFSIMKTILLMEPESRFTLFYGNQRTDSIIFKEAIEGLKNQFLNRLSVYYLLSREHTGSDLFSGRIDRERCQIFFDKLIQLKDIDECFLCGPEEMILGVRDELMEQGFTREQIYLELFGTSAAKTKKAATAVVDSDFKAEVSIQLDGNTFQFSMTNSNESVLEAALRQGADLPFACKGGVCCTCRAKLEEGEAPMAVNYALEPDEVEAGFILTCQSYPKSERIVVNFDA
ncbi:MAG: 1,2-phenylacetyl-CoA epoxidase subunit PaaE [Bacteroidota bacterium]